MSVKIDECWKNVKYFFDLLSKMETGTYLLSKAPYTPLSLKLFMISGSEDFQEKPEEEEDGEGEGEEEGERKEE